MTESAAKPVAKSPLTTHDTTRFITESRPMIGSRNVIALSVEVSFMQYSIRCDGNFVAEEYLILALEALIYLPSSSASLSSFIVSRL